ncbi:MAG TPA: hypothetical protein VG711_06205 [Phycisphaerales bacterium]|nr:hypothetical protein [Phycisphaerales bacterium]
MKNASFLPEDYVAQQAERRTNIISLVLFAVVMFMVIAAFLFTNRQWTQLMNQQTEINAKYQQAGIQIQELKELEDQKGEMMDRAQLAKSLVERVPRSILLAELINRMPPRLAILEFDMKSEKVKVAAPAKDSTPQPTKGKPTKPKTKAEAEASVQKVEPQRYKVSMYMVGVAPTDLEVSKYMNALNDYKLLTDVNLEYSEEKEVQGRTVRQFRINMALNPEADVRFVDPLIVPRLNRNPLSDQLQINPPAIGNNTSTLVDPSSVAPEENN